MPCSCHIANKCSLETWLWFPFPALPVGHFTWQGFGFCTFLSVSAGGRFPAPDCFAWKVWDVTQVWGQPCPAPRCWGLSVCPGYDMNPRMSPYPVLFSCCVLCTLPGEFPSLVVLQQAWFCLLADGEAMTGPPPPGEYTFIDEVLRVLEIIL